jgi:hypothetical protein
MRIAAGILIAGIATSANAGVIFSNLGADNSFGTAGRVVGNRTTPFGTITLEIASAFTSTSNATFTGADFALDLFGSPGDLTVALLATGPSGTPDTALETFIVPAPMFPSLVSVQSSLNPVLNAGMEYWLDIAAPSTAALWLDNDQGGRGPVAANTNDRGFVLFTDFGGNPPIQPAFRINGDPLESIGAFDTAAAAVANPEPSTLVLVICGITLYCPVRWMWKTGIRR